MTEGFLRGQGNVGTNRISWVGLPWLRVRKELETLKRGKERKYDDVYSAKKKCPS